MLVLDSSLLIAHKNEGDIHHKAAAATMTRIAAGEWGTALLPEYVFLEVVTVLAARRGLESAVAAGLALLNARDVEFVPCSEYFLDSFEAFRVQNPAGMSFADAAIVAIARKRGASHIATFDSDFRSVAGLSVVP